MTPENVPNLWKCLDEFQQQMTAIQESLTNPQEKAMLGDMLGQIAQQRGEAEKVLPGLIKDMHEKNLNLKAAAEKHLADMQTLRAEVERRAQEAAARADKAAPAQTPPPVPDVPVGLAGLLSSELLRRFAAASPKPSLFDEGSVASAWVETDASEESKSQQLPAKQDQRETMLPDKDAKKSFSSGDVWEEMSRFDDEE